MATAIINHSYITVVHPAVLPVANPQINLAVSRGIAFLSAVRG
jgi:hypothetical protein